MKNTLLLLIMLILLTATLTSCSGVDYKNESSENSALSSQQMPPNTDVIMHDGKILMFQKPQGEYSILSTVGDEKGYGVIYTETVFSTDSNQSQIDMRAQLFDKEGGYLLTSVELASRIQKDNLVLGNITLEEQELFFDMLRDNYIAINRDTGAVTGGYYRALTQGTDFFLEYVSTGYVAEQEPYFIFRLTDSEGRRYRIKTKENIDQNFHISMDFVANDEKHDDRPGITYTLLMDIDAEEKIVVLSNTKLTYTLDFNTLSYTVQRKYTPEMLEKEPLAVSPSGKKTLHLADPGGVGDAFWGDVVLQDEKGLRLVGGYMGVFDTIFVGEESFILHNITSAHRFDSDTLKELPPMEGFIFNQVSRYGELTPEKWIVGLCYDEKNELILAAVRDYTEEWEEVPVTLLVLDKEGNLKKEIPTEYNVHSFHHNYPETCSISLENGIATLSSYLDREPVAVSYLE